MMKNTKHFVIQHSLFIIRYFMNHKNIFCQKILEISPSVVSFDSYDKLAQTLKSRDGNFKLNIKYQ
jgi:hypothetical protein